MAIQWLKLCAPIAGDTGSIPGWGTKICTVQPKYVYIYVYICIYVCVYMYIYTYMCVYMYIHMYICTYVYMCIYICIVCIYVYMCVYMCILYSYKTYMDEYYIYRNFCKFYMALFLPLNY